MSNDRLRESLTSKLGRCTDETPEGNQGVEGRDRPEGNLSEKAKVRTQSRVALPVNLWWVDEAAKRDLPGVMLRRGYLQEKPYAGKPHVLFCEGEAEWLSYSTTLSPRLRRFQPTEILDLPARNMAHLLSCSQEGCNAETNCLHC